MADSLTRRHIFQSLAGLMAWWTGSCAFDRFRSNTEIVEVPLSEWRWEIGDGDLKATDQGINADMGRGQIRKSGIKLREVDRVREAIRARFRHLPSYFDLQAGDVVLVYLSRDWNDIPVGKPGWRYVDGRILRIA